MFLWAGSRIKKGGNMGVILKNGISYSGGGGGSGGGTTNYPELTNKPRINNVVLAGNKSTADLKLADSATLYVNEENEIAVGVISPADIQNLFN